MGQNARSCHGLDWIGSLSCWIGLDWILQNGPVSNSGLYCFVHGPNSESRWRRRSDLPADDYQSRRFVPSRDATFTAAVAQPCTRNVMSPVTCVCVVQQKERRQFTVQTQTVAPLIREMSSFIGRDQTVPTSIRWSVRFGDHPAACAPDTHRGCRRAEAAFGQRRGWFATRRCCQACWHQASTFWCDGWRFERTTSVIFKGAMSVSYVPVLRFPVNDWVTLRVRFVHLTWYSVYTK